VVLQEWSLASLHVTCQRKPESREAGKLGCFLSGMDLQLVGTT
jgi:hypothetical protein